MPATVTKTRPAPKNPVRDRADRRHALIAALQEELADRLDVDLRAGEFEIDHDGFGRLTLRDLRLDDADATPLTYRDFEAAAIVDALNLLKYQWLVRPLVDERRRNAMMERRS
jgi:hypothetical protein